MSITVLRAADHRRMPWKNGRGETTEVAVHPKGAGLGDFGWRISMAAVVEDGAFSIFPGIDRTLAVLGGDGIELSIAEAAPRHLTPDGAPLAFPADVAVTARLPGGPITDLNVMTRRGVFGHCMSRKREAGPGMADWRLLLATEATDLRLGTEEHALAALDAILVTGRDVGLPIAATAPVWVIDIGRA